MHKHRHVNTCWRTPKILKTHLKQLFGRQAKWSSLILCVLQWHTGSCLQWALLNKPELFKMKILIPELKTVSKLLPNYCTDKPRGCILQRLHLSSSKPVNSSLLPARHRSRPSVQLNRGHACVTHPENVQEMRVTVEHCNSRFSPLHILIHSDRRILQVYLQEKSTPW